MCGEDVGTTMTTYSLVRRAMGVTMVRSTDGLAQDDAADHDHAAHHHRTAVALGVVDELGEAERAARAAFVLELSAADDAGCLHRRREVAAGLVPAAARIGRDHHLEIAQALGLRDAQGKALGGEQRRERGEVEVTTLHACISCVQRIGCDRCCSSRIYGSLFAMGAPADACGTNPPTASVSPNPCCQDPSTGGSRWPPGRRDRTKLR